MTTTTRPFTTIAQRRRAPAPVLALTLPLTLALALALPLALPSLAHAGSVEYLSNQGADYIRTFSRNGASDGADVVVYNPAATTLLGDGLHASVGNQTLFGQYGIAHNGKRYTSDVMVPALPSLQAAWVRGDLAVFGSVTVPAGGGSLDYKEGIPYLIPLVIYVDNPDDTNPSGGAFQGSSTFLGLTLGGAYRFKDLVAISLAGRAVIARKSYDGHANYGKTRAELHTTKEAFGLGVIAGVTVTPGFGLTLGARYESKAAMHFRASTTTVGLIAMEKWKDTALESFADGASEQRDLPAVLGLGLSWSGLGLTLSTSFHRYFTRAADSTKDHPGIPGSGGMGAFVKGWDDDYNDGWDLAVAAEYDVLPALRVSVGYIRASLGGGPDTFSDFEQALDSDSVGGGVRYRLNDTVALTAALSRTFYKSGSNAMLAFPIDSNPETFDKRVYDLALGVSLRF